MQEERQSFLKTHNIRITVCCMHMHAVCSKYGTCVYYVDLHSITPYTCALVSCLHSLSVTPYKHNILYCTLLVALSGR